MTTRTYHRNSSFACPKKARYGCAIERTRPADRAVNWTLFVGAIAVILAICFGVQP